MGLDMENEQLWLEAQRAYEQGNLPVAAQLFGQLHQADPAHFMPLRMLGVIAGQQGMHDETLELMGQALARAPHDPAIQADYANALRNVGRLDEALDILNNLLGQDANFTQALDYRGAVLWRQGRLEEALADYERLLKRNPGRGDVLFRAGTILDQLGRHEEALSRYDRAVGIDPQNFDWRNSRGWARLQMGKFDAALADLVQVTTTAPQYPGGALNLAFYRLLMGDFERGLPLYEARQDLPGQTFVRRLVEPRWTGAQSLQGKTLLVHTEQGLGDTIQFCRYLPLLKEKGAEILFLVQRPLRRLLESAKLPATLCEDLPSSFDYQIPLMSLPLAFGTRLETVPAQVPYLFAEKERVTSWAERLGKSGFRIGVSWSGRDDLIARPKAFRLADLAPIAGLDGVRLISLQKGESARQLQELPAGMTVESFEDLDKDGAFVDTAAIMANCDLVITADSAPAHLAGALGLPVFTLLRHVPDWRWHLTRNDTPWYPTMRLFRQPARGDWASVIAAVKQDVEKRKG
jgi:tetratricopeptide (TPR) repeat protein